MSIAAEMNIQGPSCCGGRTTDLMINPIIINRTTFIGNLSLLTEIMS